MRTMKPKSASVWVLERDLESRGWTAWFMGNTKTTTLKRIKIERETDARNIVVRYRVVEYRRVEKMKRKVRK